MTHNPTPPANPGRFTTAGALRRYGITAAGALLVTHGWIDKATADSAVPPIAD